MSDKANDVKTFSTDELQAELRRRIEEDRRIQYAKRLNYWKAVLTILTTDLVDKLREEHGRTSCSNEKITNGIDGGHRCNKCVLLDLANGRMTAEELAESTIRISLEVTW